MTHDDLFALTRALVDRYDPEGLLAIGAPADEYDLEAHALLELVRGKEKITSRQIADLWLKYFDQSYWPGERPEELIQLAAELEALRSGST